jgi:NAD(P)-dependent dehydrogenase (short-subunit alcohol dehydrogenase family)
MDLANRVALVTGGRRMGGALARRLASRGADIAVTFNRSRTDAEETVQAVEAIGRRGIALQTDLRRPADCERAVEETVARLGRLDVLINMASVYAEVRFDALTLDHWDDALNIDLRSAFLCSRAAVPHLRRSGGGRIVNFSDWIARSGRPRYPGYLPYYVAKHAVIGLTEALALELASDGILVNAVAPGPILAPEGTTSEEYRTVERATPLGRWGGAEELAKVVIALIESDFITGETVRVDGGRHVK